MILRSLGLALLLLAAVVSVSSHTTSTSRRPSSSRPSACPEGCRCTTSYSGPKLVCDFLDPGIQQFNTDVRHLSINGKRGDHGPKLTMNYFAKIGLTKLVTLSIRNASLSEIDRAAFEGLDHLEEIDLSYNNIVNLHPSTFENNGNLRHLILRNNPGIQLTHPRSTHHSSHFLISGSLTQLILANCEIKEIPKRAFAGLGALDYLDLSGNYLVELGDECLDDLINLETLDISDNSISKIGADAFVDIDQLTVLTLRGNPLKTLEGIEVNGLEELDASRCDIEVLSAAVFDGFPELTYLNLSMNSIKDVDSEAFLTLTSLRELDLSYNSIRSPLDRFMFQNCNNLEVLSLSNNRDFRIFEGFEGRFKTLYSLDLSSCGLSQITDGTLDTVKYLTFLNVSGNNIGHIDANAFSALTHLQNLDLSNNRLTNLNSHIFLHNKMMNRLSLSGNLFRHVPAILFQPTVDLDYLDISNNRINGLWNLSESFVMKNKNILGRLTTLKVAGNKIRKLHLHSFISISQLSKLDISNNPIECTPDFSHMMQWLIVNRVIPNRDINPKPVELDVVNNNVQWNQFLNEVCPLEKKTEKTDKMLRPFAAEHSSKLLEQSTEQREEEQNEMEGIRPESRPFITIHGQPIEIPQFDETPGRMEIVEPVEDKSIVIMPLFFVWCAIGILVFAFIHASILAIRRHRNKHPNVDYKTLERGYIVRRGGRSVYQKLYEDCSVPAVHEGKNGSRISIFQLPHKV
ncbi:LRR_TYP [Nesidiocoris tenuis]|uniref:LRR_TYP n=1 Tax=Nesidiocoris tenuis TaxID=355587 RepID=A0ABN7AJP8_9HEMI|nr:LRR_TYP [Nesidiocoris tenuis]